MAFARAVQVDLPGEQEVTEEKEKTETKPKSGGKRFVIKKWNAVAMCVGVVGAGRAAYYLYCVPHAGPAIASSSDHGRWSWAICTDTCAICRNNLYEPSIEYQASPTGVWLVGGSRPGRNRDGAYKDERASPMKTSARPCRRHGSPRAEHCVGQLRPRLPPRLHPALAQGTKRVPAVQQRVR